DALMKRAKELQQAFNDLNPDPTPRPPLSKTGDLVGADRTKEKKVKESPEEREQQHELKSTLEDIASLKLKNAILAESIKANRTLAQAQERILEAENAQK